MRIIVFDIETQNVFHDVGTNDPADLDLAVIAIYDSERDVYESFTQEELPQLWPILEGAHLLVGYNSEHFDLPLLNKYYQGDLSYIPHLDLLKEIKAVLGRRIKLDVVAEATLGTKKSGHGLESIRWWRNGEVDKVRNYCIDDVRITKDVYEHAKKYGKLSYHNAGEKRDIQLDTSKWEPDENASMTGSLPF